MGANVKGAGTETITITGRRIGRSRASLFKTVSKQVHLWWSLITGGDVLIKDVAWGAQSVRLFLNDRNGS